MDKDALEMLIGFSTALSVVGAMGYGLRLFLDYDKYLFDLKKKNPTMAANDSLCGIRSIESGSFLEKVLRLGEKYAYKNYRQAYYGKRPNKSF